MGLSSPNITFQNNAHFRAIKLDRCILVNPTIVGTITGSGGSSSFSGDCSFDLIPTATLTYNLGSSSYKWNNLYVGNVHATQYYGELSYGLLHTYPFAWGTITSGQVLGFDGTEWTNVTPSSAFSGSCAFDLLPTADNTYNLGSVSYGWHTLFAYNLDSPSDSITFVNFPKFTYCYTGSGTALLGTNCPATTATAPYTWIEMVSSDGSNVYVPAWK